jgi:membrane protein implicated in regulation of membrane protease activity
MKLEPSHESKAEVIWIVVMAVFMLAFGLAYAWVGMAAAVPFFLSALVASVFFDRARKKRLGTDKGSRRDEAQSVIALAALVELRDKGEITRREFEARKARL